MATHFASLSAPCSRARKAWKCTRLHIASSLCVVYDGTVKKSDQQPTRELPPFTLLMSVYGGNTLRELERAVQSGTIEQTLPPAQLVIVRDGPVPDDIRDRARRPGARRHPAVP